MKITALGTQGWIPTQNRAGLCTAVETKGKLLILELGTGIARLLEPDLSQQLLAKYDEIHVIISHFHLDHIIGMAYLPALVGSKHIHFHSPGKVLGLDTMECLNTVFGLPYFSNPPSNWKWLATINELSEGQQFIDEIELKVRLQAHPGGSLGFVVDNKFAQITDTICDHKTIDFVRGSTLLFHECWYLEETEKDDHADLPGILEIAHAANVSQTGLIHLNPGLDEDEYSKAIKEHAAEHTTQIVNDKEVFTC